MKIFPKSMLAVLATALLSCGVLNDRVQAVPINGSIGFGGSGSASVVGNQTNIVFNNPMNVIAATGTYATGSPSVPGSTGVPLFITTATFKNFSFTGNGASNNSALTAPVLPLWTFTLGGLNTFSFDLLALDPTSTGVSTGAISLNGSGIAHETGFQDTYATFALSGTGTNFTFEIINSQTTGMGMAVPDGGSMVALLGLALIGVEGLRRRFAV